MENGTRKFFTNLFLGSLSLVAFYATYQFSNVVLEGKNYVASINGTRFITAQEFREKIGSVQAQYATQMGIDYKSEKGKEGYDQLKKQLMQELILTKVMLNNAEQEKIIITDETITKEINKIKAENFQNNELIFKNAMKKNNIKPESLPSILKEKMILQKYVEKIMNENVKLTDKDLREAYEAKKADFTMKESVEASHILVKSEAEAKKIYNEVKSGADFAKLAKKYSLDPGSKANGGSLGSFTRGQMVPEFEKTAFALKIGEVSQPVKTSFGYHILKKTGAKAEQVMPFEAVKDNLEQQTKAEKQRAFFAKWREKTISEADVKYNKGYESYSMTNKKEEKPANESKESKSPETEKK